MGRSGQLLLASAHMYLGDFLGPPAPPSPDLSTIYDQPPFIPCGRAHEPDNRCRECAEMEAALEEMQWEGVGAIEISDALDMET